MKHFNNQKWSLLLSVEMPDDIPDQEPVPAHGGPFR